MPHALSILLRYLVCLSWHAYFKSKDHQIKGTPHGAIILDRIMKHEAANQAHPLPPPPQIMDETVKIGMYIWAMGSFLG